MDVQKLLTRALEVYSTECSFMPVGPALLGARRDNAAVRKVAALEVAVPDELVVNLRGDEKRRDCVLLVRIPRAVADRLEGAEKLVLPGVDRAPRNRTPQARGPVWRRETGGVTG